MNILLVDDHPLFSLVLSEIVGKVFQGAAIHVETDLAGALSFARRTKGLDLVLLDMGLPDTAGIEALTVFRSWFPDVRVVVVSAEDDRDSILDVLGAGAAGFMPKSATPETIMAALKRVEAGDTYAPSGLIDSLSAIIETLLRNASGPLDAGRELTARQADVLRLLTEGLSNRQIAQRLDVALSTVKLHLTAVYRCLAVASRTAPDAGGAKEAG